MKRFLTVFSIILTVVVITLAFVMANTFADMQVVTMTRNDWLKFALLMGAFILANLGIWVCWRQISKIDHREEEAKMEAANDSFERSMREIFYN